MTRGYVDLQVNGYGGVDFDRDDFTADALHRACVLLREHGVAAILATVITEPLGSGCPMRTHRHDNVVQRVLSLTDRITPCVIADGVHGRCSRWATTSKPPAGPLRGGDRLRVCGRAGAGTVHAVAVGSGRGRRPGRPRARRVAPGRLGAIPGEGRSGFAPEVLKRLM